VVKSLVSLGVVPVSGLLVGSVLWLMAEQAKQQRK
jgi:hypothetical protein